ncbi:hypothetical protein DICVIV_02893 [Dictyocaulus viviparus]|uniref:Uncharacterized protein n=1 Tax=Dictyocaulus viviparus TaxID=29172 RepID=A0A0D8Y420_DICVI|nr:hypothetical protein DICVIV_02893 [Dictyocaulus viviparus]
MELFVLIAVLLLILQALTAILLFSRIEDVISRWIWQYNHKYLKPWNVPGKSPRELMRKHAICPLNTTSLRPLRIDDYGKLMPSPSVLYYIADRFEKHVEKSTRKTSKQTKNNVNDQTKSESEYSLHLSQEMAHKLLRESMERHANKLQRRRELEIYNSRKTK